MHRISKNTLKNMETIARIKTPKRVAKVVKRENDCGIFVCQIWNGDRTRKWRLYEREDDAIKALIQLAAGDYMQKDMFKQE